MPKTFSTILHKNQCVGPWSLLMAFFIVSLTMLWPGVMSKDAAAQYAGAVAGIYNDHHPPLMSFIWHYFSKIYPGPAPMFVWHLSMLYIASALFIYIFKQSKFKWWYAVYPLLPNILAYTALIVKDTGFTYTYLLSGAIMALMVTQRIQKHKTSLLTIVLLLLVYGTAVKFQAKYLLIFFSLGVAYCLYDYQFNFKTVTTGVVLYIAIFIGITTINNNLVPLARSSNSWQYVKIYDLSAMSLALDSPLYPDFILQQKNFSFDKVKALFEPREVDLLVFGSEAVIHGGIDEQQRQELWNYWFKTVIKHPWLYLQARFMVFKYDLITAPCDRNNPVQFLKTTALAPVLDIPGVSTILDLGYSIFKIMLRFVWFLPVLVFYCYLGFVNFARNDAAAPMLMFSLTSLALLVVLFFCSMAGTARYVFLCTCLVHASHGFAYAIYKKMGFRREYRLNPMPHLHIIG